MKSHSTSKRNSRTQHSSALIIEVRQAGVIQASTTLYRSQKLKKVTFGTSSRCDLTVPFGKVPRTISLFSTQKEAFHVLIEPRLSGFVNSGAEFGTIADFLNPEGAISVLATISDPYPVALGLGSRGVIRLGEFEILFKVERPVVQNKRSYVTTGAKGNPFGGPMVDSPFEKHVVFLALLFVMMLFGPAVYWLMKAPVERLTGLSNLPDQFLIQFVHPEHFRFLPKVYGTEYDPDNSVKQAVHWVSELQKRWNAEQLGKPYTSDIPILQGFVRKMTKSHLADEWSDVKSKKFNALDERRQSPKSDRFYKYQSRYPEIETTVAGGTNGSLYLRHLQRIYDLEKAYSSLRLMIQQEQDFVNVYLKEIGVTREGHFSEPSSDSEVVEIDNIDTAFSEEREAFAYAEGWSRRAERSVFWPTLMASLKKNRSDDISRPSVLWLKKTSLVSPQFLDLNPKASLEPEESIVKNAKYANRILEIPPPPSPTPVINFRKVEEVIIDRREEIRGCYENSLRQNPILEGSIQLSWNVKLNGRAHRVRVVSSSMNSPRLIHCLENLVLNWRFPRPKYGAVKVEYPFRFVVEQ